MGFWFDHTLVFFDKKITFLVNVFLIRICFTKRRETFLKKQQLNFCSGLFLICFWKMLSEKRTSYQSKSSLEVTS